MSLRLDPAKVARMNALRGLTPSKLRELTGLSWDTMARINRGEEISESTAERLLTVYQNIAVLPGMADILPDVERVA